jgi:hypothetical protein
MHPDEKCAVSPPGFPFLLAEQQRIRGGAVIRQCHFLEARNAANSSGEHAREEFYPYYNRTTAAHAFQERKLQRFNV